MNFLQTVAKDIYERFGDGMRDVTIVFPGKRAGLFFNQYLADMVESPIWSPAYKTLSEMYADLSDLEIADPVLLIHHLYAAYCEVVASKNGGDENQSVQPLDQFYSWGEVMLNDFDDIDKHLSHAKDIFHNLKDLDELTSMDYLSESQIDAIEHYFGAFDMDSKTKLKEKFLTIWNLLYPVYERFRERLRNKGIAYEGMLCRDVAEHLSAEKLSSRTYIFVGFNVLTSTDHRLLMFLKNEGRALFYWDYDKSYISDKNDGSKYFEAGRYISRNLSDFGNALSDDTPCYDEMHRKKDITFISSTTDNSQVRYAQEWLLDNVDGDGSKSETAVVLCNPNMLQTMIHSIPESQAPDTPYKINVTMGYPLSSTPIFNFIMTLLDLQVFGERGKGMWGHSYVTRILRHPYCSRLTDEASITKLQDIRKNNMLFVSESLFNDDETLHLIFTKHNTTSGLLNYLSEITRRLGISLFKQGDSNHISDFDEQLYKESVYNAFTSITRIQSVLDEVSHSNDFACIRSSEMGKERLMRLISEIMSRVSIPFHGEPAEGIQILSLLDTRNIDFKNVIMLGMNDENVPKSIHQASFIPYTLREAHGMTTMEDRSCLYAYTVYRLLQRAGKVTLLYNSSTEGVSNGDMSRYMTQLLVEQDTLLSGETRISQKALESRVDVIPLRTIVIEKNDDILSKLKEKYNVRDSDGNIINDPPERRRFFSPSAMNTYMNCPVQFYFNYVASLKAEDELSDEVGNDVFGSIFHACMESIYGSHIGEVLGEKQLLAWSRNEEMIRLEVDKAFKKEFFKREKDDSFVADYNGEQWLNHEVIASYVKKQLEYDSKLCPLRIDGVEDKRHEMLVELDGITLRLGGIIDRIDTVHVGESDREIHRIVDYKTSSSGQTADKIGKLFDRNITDRPYHILQAFYYSHIFTNLHNEPVAPALMYIKHASPDFDTLDADPSIIRIGLRKEKTAVTDFATQMKEDFHIELMSLLNEIFDKDIPFIQAKHNNHCKWCDYKDICGRKVEE